MQRFEYRVIPAPRRGNKVKGLKSTEDRYAATLAEVMNEAGREGWDYIRSDTLPVEERQGLTGHSTTWQTMLVFRRALADSAPLEVTRPMMLETPQPAPVQPAPAAPAPGPILRAPTDAPEGTAPQITPTRD